MKVLVLGASGTIGRRVVVQALSRGHDVTAQTRDAAKLADLDGRVRVVPADPRDPAALSAMVEGQDAVIFALGDAPGKATTLFSDVTQALLPVMTRAGVKRLVAVTGVGAGETRGHGGLIYDWFIFPLFTKRLYADKNRQEALIRASDREFVLVRPASYVDVPGKGPLQTHTTIPKGLQLTNISRDEVAAFVLDQLGDTPFLGKAVFVGRP